jgi:hypothetical protein
MGPKKLSRRTLIILIAFAVLLIGVVPGYFFYAHYEKTQKRLENPTDAAKVEVAKTVEAVGKLILLPSDEEPTLATVSDKTKVQDQALIQANVRNGDKILIYSQAKKAYLYRPSINKLVAIAPVNIGEQAPTIAPVNIIPTSKTTPTPATKSTSKVTPTPPSKITPTPTSAFKAVTVALYNGTKTSGLAARTQTTLKTKAPFATVVATGNAASTYTESVVIDFTGKYSKEAAELVKQVGGAIGVLPKGEVKPTADILIILGPQ